MKLQLKRLSPNVKAPEYKTTYAACFDLHVALDHVDTVTSYGTYHQKFDVPVKGDSNNRQIILEPFTRMLVPTGFIMGIPEGFSLRIHPRSSAAFKTGATLINSQGIIDRDFAFESMIPIYNVSSLPMVIKDRDRVAQAELVPVYHADIEEVDELPELESNRTGGFGSTGN